MRKLSLSLLTAGVFGAAFAAGVCTCSLTMRRRSARQRATFPQHADAKRGSPAPGRCEPEAARSPHELANWARQAMFGR